jgi:uncharacterized membrane protein YedE/YeeE
LAKNAMHAFTPLSALAGGILIGLAATLLLVATGRVAGISGILGGLLLPSRAAQNADDAGWRGWFVAGLLGAGLVAAVFFPASLGSAPRSLATLTAAGLLVGIGTRLARGCTSGHGVCGISRLSLRSIAATLTFIATGIATVALLRLFGATG